MNKFILTCFILSFNYKSNCQGFSKDWLNCILQIEKEVENGVIYHGTGFSIYNYSNSAVDKFVTCAHVLKNRYVYLRFPATDTAIKFFNKNKADNFIFEKRQWFFDGYSFRTKFELIKDTTFVVDDDLDIGIIKFSVLPNNIVFGKDTVDMISFQSIANSRILKRNQIDVGQNIYFLGFPFSIGSNGGYYGTGFFSDKKINPLLRSGIVAWSSDESKQFLIDGLSYGGNSGSPIFTRVEFDSDRQPALIGMVLGHLSNITEQAKDLDINQGLARCIWIDEILNLASKIN